jgi:biotin carboxylase
MITLSMEGPYNLNKATVEKIIENDKIGNYALGRKNDKGGITVEYVGRSDSCIKKRLLKWVTESDSPSFKYSYAESIKEAFEKECKNYHNFNPTDNNIHPDKPDGKNYKCPVCGE